MEVRQLNTLIRAAQFQSFSKAAESLGYSQSAVTVQIKALEEELGVRLFDRMGKRVILTAQGQCFLEYANSILDTIHNARRALSEDAELEGCLHIGTLESLLFPSARPDASVPGGTPQSQPSGHYRLPGRADRKDGARRGGPHLHSGRAPLLQQLAQMQRDPGRGGVRGLPGHRPRPPRPVPGSRASGQALLPHRTQRQLPPHL